MSTDSESDTRCICNSCIRDSYLQKEILDKGTTRVCSICEEEEWTFTLEEIADHIDRAFEEHYDKTSDEPDPVTLAMGHEWYRDGEEIKYIIAGLLGIDEDIADEIRDILDDRLSNKEDWEMGIEGRFSSDARYEEKAASIYEHLDDWESLVRIVQTQARHFSPVVQDILESIFGHLKDANDSPAITQAGPGQSTTKLYRTRVFENHKDAENAIKRPDLEIRPPPPGTASAGRMNAQGISAFYGARDLKTAIAETRPPVGSTIVSGEFTILKPLRLLDLAAQTETYPEGSVFDPEYIKTLEKKAFLTHLSEIMSRPVLPSSQTKEYLPTQIVAEYLANQIGLDGIIYTSAQAKTDSSNVVIFQRHSKVEEIELPQGTEISADLFRDTESGAELDPTVIEETPEEETTEEVKDPMTIDGLSLHQLEPSPDTREPTLKIDLETVHIHQVQSVQINCQSAKVTRLRWKKNRDF